jgi:hypothetical protein
MELSPKSHRTWTDEQLVEAVAASRSWRGVLRQLGLSATSAASVKTAKSHVNRLGLDTSHFTGQRTWSDAALKRAAADAHSWSELLAGLGISDRHGDDRTRIKGHALRLAIDLSHLDARSLDVVNPASAEPDLKYLRDSATSIAAGWFSPRGYGSALPVEPTVYDLLVSMPEGIKRVQVKTTTCKTKDGWRVRVGRTPYSIGNKERQVPYDPELIDLFFIMDGGLNMYLIPSLVIAGRVAILLRTYKKYAVGNARGLMVPHQSNVA